MARIVFSLLALFVSATNVLFVAGQGHVVARAPHVIDPTPAIGNLEALCKQTHNPNACVALLKPAYHPNIKLDSLEWYRKVLSKSLSKAIISKEFMTKNFEGMEPREKTAVMSCVEKMSDSVELLQQVSHEYVEMFKAESSKDFLYGWHRKNVNSLMNTATADQEACYNSLVGFQNSVMVDMMVLAKNAYTANKIVAEVVLKN